MRSIGSIWKATLRAMALSYSRSVTKVSTPSCEGAVRLDRKGVGDDAGEAPGRGQHHVEGDVVAGEGGVAREPVLGGSHDPPPLLRRDREGGVVGCLPPLDLDEGEPSSFQRDEVDLADRSCVTLRHDAVAFEPEEKGNQRLREATASIGPDPLAPLPHLRLSLSPRS